MSGPHVVVRHPGEREPIRKVAMITGIEAGSRRCRRSCSL